MRLRTIAETAAGVGHAALDVAGLVPGAGEAADLANAIWYIREGDYLSAALSIISMVPEVGDVIGKGAKYLGKGSKTVQSLLAKHSDVITKNWDKALQLVQRSQKLKPYAAQLDAAIKQAIQEQPEQSEQAEPADPRERQDQLKQAAATLLRRKAQARRRRLSLERPGAASQAIEQLFGPLGNY